MIVAHSQGAAATLDALGGILDHDETAKSPAPPPGGLVPDALVTFGSGVNQLVSLKVLSAGRLKVGDLNAAPAAVVATLGMIALLVILFVSIRSETTSYIGQLVRASTFVLVMNGVVWGAIGLTIWAPYLIDKLTAWGLLGARQPAARQAAKARDLLALARVLSVWRPAHCKKTCRTHNRSPNHSCHVSFWRANDFLGCDAGHPVAHHTNCGDETRAPPPGLVQVDGRYASADPVPNGPTRIEGAYAEVTTEQVWNRGAPLSDHTTYWENLDGFVLRVARMCAETAESPWRDKLPPATQANWLDRRAAFRVGLLRWMVWGNRVLWAFVLYLLWTRHEASVPVPFNFPPGSGNGDRKLHDLPC